MAAKSHEVELGTVGHQDVEENHEAEEEMLLLHRAGPSVAPSPQAEAYRQEMTRKRTWILVGMLVPILVVIILFTTYGDGSGKLQAANACSIQDNDFPQLESVICSMTITERIGQMVVVDRKLLDPDADDITNYNLGAVLSGGGSSPPAGKGALDWYDMVRQFSEKALKTRQRVPLIYGIDAVHGHNNVINATIFPHNVGLGATGDPDLVRRIGVATAEEVVGTGIRWVYAPCVAVCRDPRWGRCYESYSEDPELVARLGSALIDGLQAGLNNGSAPIGASVATTAKHFVGDGGTTGGKDEGDTECSLADLRRLHLPPFQAAVSRNVMSIMVSYSSWNGDKMHGNKYLLTDVLKGELGFKGFLVSDWDAINQLPQLTYGSKIEAAINAGLDMIMLGTQPSYKEFLDSLLNEIRLGRIPQQRIDDAVHRVLRAKAILQLFQHPIPDKSLLSSVGSVAHRNLARQAVRKSLVLLKNGGGDQPRVLPLQKDGLRILVAGSGADNIGLQCGGWTIEWQGKTGPITAGTTILAAVLGAVRNQSLIIHSTAAAPVEDADVAIVVAAEPTYAEYKGDNQDLQLTDFDKGVISATCSRLKCVLVLVTGRPLDVSSTLPSVHALVAAWLPGTEGKGVADVLFGDYEFVGKLPRTWFRSVDQLPINAGDKGYDPLFKYGYGLSSSGQVLG